MKAKKKQKKSWPQNLTKKKLLEDTQYLSYQLDSLENEVCELTRECERRGIHPWE